MQRRGLTVLVGALLVAVLGLAIINAPVPYAILGPGPTWDTLGEDGNGNPIIVVEGIETAPTTGELRLTTVSADTRVTLPEVFGAWLNSRYAVVPRELIIPPGQSQEEVNQRNAEQFTRSQNSAEVAALRYLGYPTRVTVARVVEGAPAEGRLAAGDVITSVDGVEVTEATQLQQLVSGPPAGTTLTIGYLRDGQPGSVAVTTEAIGDDDTGRIGVEISTEFDVPFELSIQLDRIGGPSAGLMFALGIIDKLDPEDLTGGRIIAGTGTIDEAGNVGPIGGVPQKLVAAHDLGAEAFLLPSANCAEALENAPEGLPLLRVDTLEQAVQALADLRADRQPPTC